MPKNLVAILDENVLSLENFWTPACDRGAFLELLSGFAKSQTPKKISIHETLGKRAKFLEIVDKLLGCQDNRENFKN